MTLILILNVPTNIVVLCTDERQAIIFMVYFQVDKMFNHQLHRSEIFVESKQGKWMEVHRTEILFVASNVEKRIVGLFKWIFPRIANIDIVTIGKGDFPALFLWVGGDMR